MEIFYFNDKIDFTLENEKTLFDIYNSISKWLSENDQMISKILVNENDYDIKNLELMQRMSIANIEKIQIETKTNIDYITEILNEIRIYISKFTGIIESNIEYLLNNYNEFIDGIKWIIEAYGAVCKSGNVEFHSIFFEDKTLEEALNFLSISITELNKHKHDDKFIKEMLETGIKDKLILLQNLNSQILKQVSLKHAIKYKIKDIGLLNTIIDDHIKDLEIFIPKLSEIGIMVQTKKDLEAFSNIKKIINITENLVLLLTSCEIFLDLNFKEISINNEDNLESINKYFLEQLEEWHTAFKNNDLVLLADVLEYEIADYYSKYIEFLKLIKNKYINQ